MPVENIAKNIYRIPVPLGNTPLKELNAYLIKGDGRYLLIDTGFRREDCRIPLLEGLAEIGVDLEKMDIFLTHLHSDHSGNAPEIIRGDNHIYLSQIDRSYILGYGRTGEKASYDVEKCRKGGMPEEEITAFFNFDASRDVSPHPDPDKLVGVPDGYVFHIGGYDLRCVLTPGHSPGHMCLWAEEQGIMFTGDHVLFDITPNIVCWHGFEDALGQYLDSLKRVKDFDVKMALPGHRKPGDFHSRIEEIRAHHQVRLRECLRLMEEEPGLTAYELTRLMRWRIRAKSWEDGFPVSQKYFALGECLSHLAYLEKRGFLTRELVDGTYRYTRLGEAEPVVD